MVFVTWHKGGPILNSFVTLNSMVPFVWVLGGICRAGPCVRPHGLVWQFRWSVLIRDILYRLFFPLPFFEAGIHCSTIVWTGVLNRLKLEMGRVNHNQEPLMPTWGNPCYFLLFCVCKGFEQFPGSEPLEGLAGRLSRIRSVAGSVKR